MKFKITLIIIATIFLNITCRFHLTKKKFSNYLRRFQRDWPTVSKSTKLDDWGGGATIFLDRHDVDCETGALTSFQLRTIDGAKLKYDYKCIMPKDCKPTCTESIKKIDKDKCLKKSTPLNELPNQDGKHTNYLDRHKVECDSGFVLTQFRFNRVPPKIKYDYTCCPAKVNNCNTFISPKTDFGDYGSIYLDRQNIQVPDINNQAITSFLLQTDYGSHSYTYTVGYCNVTG